MRELTLFDISSSIYVPATNKDLDKIVTGEKYPELKSMILCCEDSILESELDFAIKNIVSALLYLRSLNLSQHPFIFLRPRSIKMASMFINQYPDILNLISGLALPKFKATQISQWQALTEGNNLQWMPILETKEVFDINAMILLADQLKEKAFNKIIALRVGGNDLLNLLNLRRNHVGTIYDSPLSYIINMLVTTFIPRGFKLTAPVFEQIENIDGFKNELELDKIHGFIGKTVIHPKQVAIVNDAFKVSGIDFKEAQKIINAKHAVFKSNGSMSEIATHGNWAKQIIERANYFGIKENS